MKNYIFLLIAITLIGTAYFVLGETAPESIDHMRSMAKVAPSQPQTIDTIASAELLSLSSLANITGILSFFIQIGVWIKSMFSK